MAGCRGFVVLANERDQARSESRRPARKSCGIFSAYARSVEANGDAGTSLQTTLPIRLGKNIAPTRRRSWHWRLSERPKSAQIRWYENLLVAPKARRRAERFSVICKRSRSRILRQRRFGDPGISLKIGSNFDLDQDPSCHPAQQCRRGRNSFVRNPGAIRGGCNARVSTATERRVFTERVRAMVAALDGDAGRSAARNRPPRLR